MHLVESLFDVNEYIYVSIEINLKLKQITHWMDCIRRDLDGTRFSSKLLYIL